jgi:hypothetical protein
VKVASAIVNPDNLRADYEDRGELYFSKDSVVLSRVPTLFLTLGVVYTILMAVGVSLLHEPLYHNIRYHTIDTGTLVMPWGGRRRVYSSVWPYNHVTQRYAF